jgi:hypothetical protein
VSKVRKRSSEEFDGSDIFADHEFDADTFVEDMDDKGARQKADTRAGWRRLEALRDERMLRNQLLDWEDLDDNDAF